VLTAGRSALTAHGSPLTADACRSDTDWRGWIPMEVGGTEGAAFRRIVLPLAPLREGVARLDLWYGHARTPRHRPTVGPVTVEAKRPAKPASRVGQGTTGSRPPRSGTNGSTMSTEKVQMPCWLTLEPVERVRTPGRARRSPPGREGET